MARIEMNEKKEETENHTPNTLCLCIKCGYNRAKNEAYIRLSTHIRLRLRLSDP